MSDNLLQPLRTVKVGAKEYALLGDFNTLRALQQAFDIDLLYLQRRVQFMRQDEVARFIVLAAQCNGQKVTEEEVGAVLIDDIGINTPEYETLRAELMAWLAIAMTPKKDRAKKAEEMEAVLKKLQLPASPGQNTNSSV